MEVQIMSRETIKPSSPTPHHLRTYKLCLFDQLASPFYIPIILFYSATDHENPGIKSDHLKNSLSKALTLFYPFAGRVKDDLTIDCNDDGATFIEAQLGCDLSFVLEDPKIEVLQQLLPCNPRQNLLHQTQSSTDQVMLAVQLNYFACDGISIGICISHVIADASAATNFLKAWAAVGCGSDINNIIEGVISDCSTIFPPQDLSNFYRVLSPIDEKIHMELPEDKLVTKRFVFDGSKIAALRNEMVDELNMYRPTRVEAVSALIWEALIAATTEIDGTSPILVVAIPVSLRNRINPPLPQRYIGNVSFSAMVSSLDEEIKNRSSLAKKIRETIKEIDHDCIRKTYMGTGEWLDNLMEKVCEEFEKNPKFGVFYFTSWCRFPFYETDFGFGKPIWFEGGLRVNRNAMFLDTCDGEGIEAWITLSKEEMTKLEQQSGIITYSSFKSSFCTSHVYRE
ncbi:vinorine synthase-like [Durio zibethinus]|uniref:Vinorine synthase-like n=1 Tax=Durio zibethinus TaxID=66656 RepID=A0A6P5WUZ4_DURZI|nr:vinorine synthase-like [Durio zibethinus]